MVKAIANTLDISLTIFEHSKETVAFTAEILTSKLKLDTTSEESKKITAYKLFEILYPIKPLGKYPRIASLVEIMSSTRILTVSMLFTSLFTVLIYLILRFKGVINVQRLEPNPTLILTIPMTAVVMMTFFQLVFKTKSSKRSSIWLQCCNQLDINDSILTKIVPTEYLKYW